MPQASQNSEKIMFVWINECISTAFAYISGCILIECHIQWDFAELFYGKSGKRIQSYLKHVWTDLHLIVTADIGVANTCGFAETHSLQLSYRFLLHKTRILKNVSTLINDSQLFTSKRSLEIAEELHPQPCERQTPNSENQEGGKTCFYSEKEMWAGLR